VGRLARTGWPLEQEVVAASSRHLDTTASLRLSTHVAQVSIVVSARPVSLPNAAEEVHRQRLVIVGELDAGQDGETLSQRADTDDLDPGHESRLRHVEVRHDHAVKPCLAGRQHGRQHTGHSAKAAVEGELTEHGCCPETVPGHVTLGYEQRERDGQIIVRPHLGKVSQITALDAALCSASPRTLHAVA